MFCKLLISKDFHILTESDEGREEERKRAIYIYREREPRLSAAEGVLQLWRKNYETKSGMESPGLRL